MQLQRSWLLWARMHHWRRKKQIFFLIWFWSLGFWSCLFEETIVEVGLGARGQLYDHVNNPPLTNGFKRWTVGPSVSESSRLVSANGPDCRGFMEMSIMACLIYARNTNTKPLSSVPQTSPFEEKICLACSVPPFLASYGYISWQDLVSQHVDLAMEHIYINQRQEKLWMRR